MFNQCLLLRAHVAFTLLLGAFVSGLAKAADLPRSTPELQGVRSTDVASFVVELDRLTDSLHSLLVVRHGHVIAEGAWAPYRLGARHSLYSLSKSFTSTAVGLAIAEGKFGVDDPVLGFFPEAAPTNPSDHLKAMTVRDLLCMNTGHETEPSRSLNIPFAAAFLAHPVPFEPGKHFLYNTSATYMLSAIVHKTTGATVPDFLRPRLFDPLEIKDPVRIADSSNRPAAKYQLSMRLRAEEIARFGQLYLQKGNWNGKQLVPADWIELATARQVSNGSNADNDWNQGYGFQFWRGRHGTYRADGAYGQLCVVLPDSDAVVVITAGTNQTAVILNLIWEKLLPAFQDKPLQADASAVTNLEKAVQKLSIQPQRGSASAAEVWGNTYRFSENARRLETVSIEQSVDDGAVTCIFQFGGKRHQVKCGKEVWIDGKAGWGASQDSTSMIEQPVACSGAWAADHTFTFKLCFYETPFIFTVDLKFIGNELDIHVHPNVGVDPNGDWDLKGVLQQKSATINAE